jgi:hypothetical protein
MRCDRFRRFGDGCDTRDLRRLQIRNIHCEQSIARGQLIGSHITGAALPQPFGDECGCAVG